MGQNPVDRGSTARQEPRPPDSTYKSDAHPCNDVFGYLPSARVLSEGGYETRGLYAGGVGLFDAKAEQLVVESVRDLAKKAGRPFPE